MAHLQRKTILKLNGFGINSNFHCTHFRTHLRLPDFTIPAKLTLFARFVKNVEEEIPVRILLLGLDSGNQNQILALTIISRKNNINEETAQRNQVYQSHEFVLRTIFKN